MSSKWGKMLQNMEGSVDLDYNPFSKENVLKSNSPSLNWIFGKGSGIPYGFGALLFGPPKSGKSLVLNSFIQRLHEDTKDGIAIKFNTEMREEGQTNTEMWGIDKDRYFAFNVNEPHLIFDRIKKELLPMIQNGMPVKLIIIDSLRAIQGVKEMNRESINDHLIGDHALTIKNGLKMILPIIRRNRIALICTEHIVANMDAGSYGPKDKMAGGFYEKHTFEYFIEVKRDNSAESKKDLDGNAFVDENVKDFRGNKEATGHKIYIKMHESSTGVAGRSGQFTLSYNGGIINTHEEIFELAKNLNLVERPNNRTYVYEGKTYTSKGDFAEAIKSNPEIQSKLLDQIYSRDVQ